MSVFFKPACVSIESYQAALKEKPEEFESSTLVALAHHAEQALVSGLNEEQVAKIHVLALKRNQEILHAVKELNAYCEAESEWRETTPQYAQYKQCKLEYNSAMSKACDAYLEVTYSPLPIADSLILPPPNIKEGYAYGLFLGRNTGILELNQITGLFIFTKDEKKREEYKEQLKEKITFCISRFNYSFDELHAYFDKPGFRDWFLDLFKEFYPICQKEAEALKNNVEMENKIKAVAAGYNQHLVSINEAYQACQVSRNEKRNEKVKTKIPEVKNNLKDTLGRISAFCTSNEILVHPKVTNESKSRFMKIISPPKFSTSQI